MSFRFCCELCVWAIGGVVVAVKGKRIRFVAWGGGGEVGGRTGVGNTDPIS